MPVYMIRAGESGPIKIGWGKNVSSRCSGLQTAHYEILSILRVVPGNQDLEVGFHHYFINLRIRGEWFRYDSEMEVVDSATIMARFSNRRMFEDSKAFQPHIPEADRIIAAFGGTKPLSEITGASRNAVANWARDGIPAKYWPLLARTARKKRIRTIGLETLEKHEKRNGPTLIESEPAAE